MLLCDFDVRGKSVLAPVELAVASLTIPKMSHLLSKDVQKTVPAEPRLVVAASPYQNEFNSRSTKMTDTLPANFIPQALEKVTYSLQRTPAAPKKEKEFWLLSEKN